MSDDVTMILFTGLSTLKERERKEGRKERGKMM